MRLIPFITVWLLFIPLLSAQLTVAVTPPKVTGQKVLVKLTLKNDTREPVESARAVCFVLDEQGKMVGQSAQWVIGGTKDRPPLAPEKETTFNFVITTDRPTTTNLTARVEFSRLLLPGGKPADIKSNVTVRTAPAEAPKPVK